MFKRMMLTLRGHVEFFCYHQREIIIFEVIWGIVKDKNKRATPEERRDGLIAMIQKQYEREVNP